MMANANPTAQHFLKAQPKSCWPQILSHNPCTTTPPTPVYMGTKKLQSEALWSFNLKNVAAAFNKWNV